MTEVKFNAVKAANVVNVVHAVANEVHARFVDVYGAFVGRNVVRMRGDAVGTMINPTETFFTRRLARCNAVVIKDTSTSVSMSYSVSSDPAAYGGVAYSVEVQVGTIRDGVLTGLIANPNLKTDYTVEAMLNDAKVMVALGGR